MAFWPLWAGRMPHGPMVIQALLQSLLENEGLRVFRAAAVNERRLHEALDRPEEEEMVSLRFGKAVVGQNHCCQKYLEWPCKEASCIQNVVFRCILQIFQNFLVRERMTQNRGHDFQCPTKDRTKWGTLFSISNKSGDHTRDVCNDISKA